MGNLLIRRLPEETIRMAKELAHKHHRSLQEELSAILVKSINFHSGKWSAGSDVFRKRLSKTKKTYSDSSLLLRQDRDR